jgi:leucyl-tRNA synthetase
MSIERYNARRAEIHWQQVWDARKAFAARDNDLRPSYVLHLSGRIHLGCLGHARNWTMGDVVARYKRANGFNVLYLPDAFSMSAKNTAARSGVYLRGLTSRRAATRAQLGSMGLSLDWAVTSCDPAHDRPPRAAGLGGADDPFEVDLDDIIETYGADAVRWFVLSDSPPDRELVWTDSGGIHGAWRFVHRLWRLINAAKKFSQGTATPPSAFSDPALKVRKAAHRALARVSGNIARLRFNVCVAHIYAFARALEAVVANSSGPASPDLKFAAREAAEIMVQLFHPMMPHLAEECWAALGHTRLLATQSWPALDADLLVGRRRHASGPCQRQEAGRGNRCASRPKQRYRSFRSRARCRQAGAGRQDAEESGYCPAEDRQCRGLKWIGLAASSSRWRALRALAD